MQKRLNVQKIQFLAEFTVMYGQNDNICNFNCDKEKDYYRKRKCKGSKSVLHTHRPWTS